MGFGRPGTENIKGPLGQALDSAVNSAQTNQIRGVSVSGNTGSGIPKQVSGVGASISNAATGATSVLKVTFRRDPSDKNFQNAQLYLRGYSGNNANVLVASGSESPITAVLNNTGESIVVTIQAVGNSGSAPIGSSPTTGIRLPKSASGGFGTGSATGVQITGTPTSGALAVWSSATSIGQGNLTGDTVTSGSTSTTVQKIRGVPVSTAVPATGDTLRYNEFGTSQYDLCIGVPRSLQMISDGGSTTSYSVGWSSAPVAIGSKSLFAATATEGGGVNYFNIAGVGSTSDLVCLEQAFGASNGSLTYGCFRRLSCRLLLGAGLGLTNSRFWVGLSKTSPQFGTTAYSTNTPNFPYAMFRYTNGTDANIKCVCGTSSAAQTVVDSGIPPDTSNSQLFDIVYTGAAFKFFINGALVGTISTNKPAATDLWGHGIIGDNQNAANNIGFTHFWSIVAVK